MDYEDIAHCCPHMIYLQSEHAQLLHGHGAMHTLLWNKDRTASALILAVNTEAQTFLSLVS